MSFVQQIMSYGVVTIVSEADMQAMASYLIWREMSFKVMFDVDGTAIFTLVEPEDQK